MWICDRKRVTLFFYHPDLPHLWVELKRDTDFDVALYEQVRSVIAERDHLVEILGAYA
jgi:hypothetical protein